MFHQYLHFSVNPCISGGSSEIRTAADCAWLIAGGGGGSTVDSNKASGYGGKGGCVSRDDDHCKGSDAASKKFSGGANQTSGNGQSSEKSKEEGGGGGGFIGGDRGSDSQVGGNGGLTTWRQSYCNLSYSDESHSYAYGFQQGNGSVTISVVKP